MKKQKVLVGMSGGVDSSVTAALLLEQGYEVIGAFMKNWSGSAYTKCDQETCKTKEECNWRDERRDAMRVAAFLGIPFVTFDFEKEYRRDVIEYLFREFEAGRTPNPDVMCNKYVKFDLFVKEADKLGCDFVATGHYAQIDHKKDRIRILMGKDDNKDQTYFLWAIPPTVLNRVLFPVGHMNKSDVRKKAKELGLLVHDKKDSVGICFVGEVDMQAFLKERIPEDPGEILTTEGKIVGTHPGVNFFTIGQRKGLGTAGGPYYVVAKEAEKKQLIVSSQFHPTLYKKQLEAIQLNWFHPPDVVPHECLARVRYRQKPEVCTIKQMEKGKVAVFFKKEQRAITPGQSIVFYDGEEMIGGGIIE
ncbi:MAG: tRNA-specific 2-thiouridylase MnmA [Candidatus Uhrbacteria bacterium GW2011_GWE2_40_58]|nr:MAG: tRNA-specific 2-thiouridylase MnmA [Candidatus Uhrbacteria bacterium GW2011_GWF2_40_263]KKR68114.1 MAG: tRNA-specific 2-thiouridylase MnmA [Candidatus Uhrbacteria bacterium GW2011_GWE2_40_58]OGL91814.1 MAG: tRNA 2-thiouridine(34) synthase MnmA [Candidatus Uhrbacteria bacterium RIFOXYA2_FULL_40_9]OGL97264.1 MAG: tRNA 2-thiouridine(34) synthase MnmA [Candidatus Uhrbacteria bacterium RIFOXYB2_FULL_41_18]HBK34428.1 tRNA 2-thiouridine(34) synthase MnmA [Candidatus Uhrbacteria bacterium]